MLTLAIVIGYFLTGMVSGRILFVKSLGEAARHYYKDKYANMDVANDFSKIRVKKASPELEKAQVLAVFGLILWPVLLPFNLMVEAPTPHERAIAKDKQQRELEARFKELEAEVAAFGKKM